MSDGVVPNWADELLNSVASLHLEMAEMKSQLQEVQETLKNLCLGTDPPNFPAPMPRLHYRAVTVAELQQIAEKQNIVSFQPLVILVIVCSIF